MHFLKTVVPFALTLSNLFDKANASPVNSLAVHSDLQPRAICATEWSCKSGAIQDVQCVGSKSLDGPGYWVCMDVCWVNEGRVRARLKVHKSITTSLSVSGYFSIYGKGVEEQIELVENTGGYGSDKCDASTGTFYDADTVLGPSKERIFGIRFGGYLADGRFGQTGQLYNPKAP